ncbi:unnamed protein product [Prorocentrum cordatum]|uniref:Uncharacterized protein n=1 Tax=Prorocentrum cordatum TaxID=2364126 RepID=A0ABN9RPC6_9DINO|nr:unnamed protein product [Polarella glacialis]
MAAAPRQGPVGRRAKQRRGRDPCEPRALQESCSADPSLARAASRRGPSARRDCGPRRQAASQTAALRAEEQGGAGKQEEEEEGEEGEGEKGKDGPSCAESHCAACYDAPVMGASPDSAGVASRGAAPANEKRFARLLSKAIQTQRVWELPHPALGLRARGRPGAAPQASTAATEHNQASLEHVPAPRDLPRRPRL